MTERALVIGGGVCGTQAALDIAGSGIPVTLVEMSPELHMGFGDRKVFTLRPKLLEAYAHPGIQVLTNTEVVSLGGENGALIAKVLRHPRYVIEDRCTSCGRVRTGMSCEC